LALSSLSRRSIYVAIAWAGFVFLTLTLSGILIGIRIDAERHHIVREGIAKWVEDHPPPPGVRMWGPNPAMRWVPGKGKGGGRLVNLQAGGKLPRELTQAANDRFLADRMAWQFPWTWSAGVLGGLWLFSVLVLSSRVKSLDRLK